MDKPEIFTFKKSDKIVFLAYFQIIAFIIFLGLEGAVSWRYFILLIWFIISSFCSVYFVIYVLFKKFLVSNQYLTLILLVSILFIIMGLLDTFIYAFILDYQNGFEELPSDFLFIGLIVHTSNVGILLTFLMGKKLTEAHMQFLKEANARKTNELSLLKAQINPHFLFNNLNTLDALIELDPIKAKVFIQRLSKTYWYLLTIQNEDVVELEHELNFAKNYSYLIQERYGDLYQFFFTLKTTELTNKLIPPGAIQMLFENIVKHNTASVDQPILIDLCISETHITIKNNINLKEDKKVSSGIGLANLKARYHLLSNQEVNINSSEKYFIVTLPIINQLNP